MKSIIREVIAMIILICAILLILLTIFFDYIKEYYVEVSAATYKTSLEEQNILSERNNYLESQNSLILSAGYTISEDDLSYYKSTGNLVQGQSSPFDEIPVTSILHAANGDTYYEVSNSMNNGEYKGSVSGDYYEYMNMMNEKTGSQTTTQSTSDEFNNDISAPSVESGSIIPSTGK